MIKYVKIKENSDFLSKSFYNLYKYAKEFGLPDKIKVLKENNHSYLLDLPIENNYKYYWIYKTECDIICEEYDFSEKIKNEVKRILNMEDF